MKQDPALPPQLLIIFPQGFRLLGSFNRTPYATRRRSVRERDTKNEFPTRRQLKERAAGKFAIVECVRVARVRVVVFEFRGDLHNFSSESGKSNSDPTLRLFVVFSVYHNILSPVKRNANNWIRTAVPKATLHESRTAVLANL